MKQPRIGLLGAGNMAEALLSGWLRANLAPKERIIASDPRPERLVELAGRHGIDTEADNVRLVERSDLVVVAVKPQLVSTVLGAVSGALSDRHLVVSIAAGVSIRSYEEALANGVRVVRVMPNTPAIVGSGATAIARGNAATDDDVALVESLFQAVGTTVVVPESSMDAVTGLSGSGPAYVMLFIEALADGGVKAGLPRDIATELAAHTVLGAARLLVDSGEHPGVLKDRVTSPGGTTIAGVAELERRGLRGAVIDAVVAAAQRSNELGRGAR